MAKIKKIDAPLLIVGLGGTGSEAAYRIKKEFNNRFEMAKNTDGSFADVPEKTRFLIIDTDKSEKSKWNWSDHEFCEISGDISLMNDKDRRNAWENSWFDQDFRDPHGYLTSGNGAGVYRQLSRLFLFRNTAKVLRDINTAIHDIQNVAASEPKQRRLHIVVLAGLSGGTGSGTFLDVAYLIRHTLKQANIGEYRLEVALVMPDVTIEHHASTDPAKQRLYKTNSYAALTELDFWMGYKSHKHLYRQQYDQSTIIEWDSTPYDDVIFLCKERLDHQPIKNTWDHVMSVLAEYYVNCFAGDEKKRIERKMDKASNSMVENSMDEGQAVAAKEYSFESMRSNELAQLEQLRQEYFVPYRYRSIGAFSNSGDEGYIIDLQWSKIYDFVDKTMEEHPANMGTTDAKAIANELVDNYVGLDANSSLRSWYNEQHPIPDYMAGQNDKTIAAIDYEAAPNGLTFCNYKDSCLDKREDDAIILLKNAKVAINNALRAVITDKDRGPEYAYTVMIHVPDGIIAKLSDVKEGLEKRLNFAQQKLRKDENPNGTVEHLRNQFCETSALIHPLRKKALYEEYTNGLATMFNAMQAVGYYSALKLAIDDIIAYAERYQALLGEMNMGLRAERENYAQKMRGTAADALDLLNREKVEGELIREFQDNQNDLAALIRIYNCIADNVEKAMALDLKDIMSFTKEDVARMVSDSIDGMRREVFADLLGKPLETLISVYGNTKGASNIQEYAKTILMPMMENGSMPMFAVEGEMSALQGNAIEGYMGTVPDAADNIVKGMLDYLKTNNIPVNIKRSSVSDRIFWVTTISGFPLKQYRLLDDLRQNYISTRETHHAYHLCMNNNHSLTHAQYQDWSKLPSITCPRYVAIPTDSPEESAKKMHQAGIIDILYTWDNVDFTVKVEASHKRLRSNAAYITVEEIENKIAAAQAGSNRLAELNAIKTNFDNIPIAAEHLRDKAEAWAKVLRKNDITQETMDATTPSAQLAKIREAWEECYTRAIYEYVSRCPQLLNEMMINNECFNLIEKALEPNEDDLKQAAGTFAMMCAYGKIVVGRAFSRFVSDSITEENEILFDISEAEHTAKLEKRFAGLENYNRTVQSLLYYTYHVHGDDLRDGEITNEVAEISAEIRRCDRNGDPIKNIEIYIANADKVKTAMTDQKTKIKQLKVAGTISGQEFDAVNMLIDAGLAALKKGIDTYRD